MKIMVQLFLCLFLLNCSTSSDSNRGDNQIVDFEIILDSSRFFENENLITVVLNNQEEEQSFLHNTPRNQYWTSSEGPFFFDFPEVDYQNYMVIGILLGMRGIGNTEIRIDSIEKVSGTLIVKSTEILPSTQEDLVGYPAVMVKIKNLNLPVVFEDIKFLKE